MLALCGGSLGERTMGAWCELLLSLERLDEAWTKLLEELSSCWETLDYASFADYMAARQEEYEQLLVYFVYRHMANAVGEWDLAACAGFAALGYTMIYALGAMLRQKNGAFSFDDQVELARLFSSEIEYSDENLDILLDALC
jgi:lysine-N-methylase